MYNIELFSNVWHLISAFLVFVLGLFISIFISRKLTLGDKITVTLYAYHTLFCFVYLFYVLLNGGDAIVYYKKSEGLLTDFRTGTVAVIYLISFLRNIDLSIVGIFLVFNIVGFVGLSFFYAVLKQHTENSSTGLQRLALLLVFLPSVSFWSSGIGKDSISFMAMGLALYAALNFNKRIVFMMLAVGLMLFVRPHMAGIMLIAIVASIALTKQMALMPRIIIGSVGLLVAAVMIPFALEYAGLEADASNFSSYIETRQGHNQQGGGGVDISSMSLPTQMFTYMFRPLFFEARSITQLLASLDNMLILYLVIITVKIRLSIKRLKFTGNRIFMWWYVVISWVLLSMTTANLGIAMRQKWMFTPILIFLLISIIAAAQEKTTNNNYYDNNK
jgi:hypothetical protein